MGQTVTIHLVPFCGIVLWSPTPNVCFQTVKATYDSGYQRTWLFDTVCLSKVPTGTRSRNHLLSGKTNLSDMQTGTADDMLSALASYHPDARGGSYFWLKLWQQRGRELLGREVTAKSGLIRKTKFFIPYSVTDSRQIYVSLVWQHLPDTRYAISDHWCRSPSYLYRLRNRWGQFNFLDQSSQQFFLNFMQTWSWWHVGGMTETCQPSDCSDYTDTHTPNLLLTVMLCFLSALFNHWV